MRTAEVHVLGPVEVVAGDGPVRLASKHVRLLGALVVAGGRACGLDELAEAVWAGVPPASGRKLIQVYVSQLRKALPPEIVIKTRGAAYALEIPSDGLDATRFERLLAECRVACDAGNVSLAASLADRALSLWRGRAYGDLAYEEFARAESERLEELRLVARELRLDAYLALGRELDALGEALALAAEHPYRERVHELAMIALYRSGRQTEALEHYAAVRARLDELGLEPGQSLRDLQRRILQQDPALDASVKEAEAGAALPLPPNPLVGREHELRELQALLERREARLVVLTGAGGSGKTRLALEAARGVARSFANGVTLVELAPLRDPELILPTIARAVDVADGGGADPFEALTRALAPLELLLVVDNAEHLREGAPLLSRLVGRAPHVTILVTSRAVLHVSGETVFPVAPLEEDAAVDLFVQRARSLRPSFELTADNAEDVREICRRVDGLPLAVELAAARIRLLGTRTIHERLDAALGLLTGGPRDVPARQQTLRDTIRWSVDLLVEQERGAFARLGVFSGPWSLEAAQEICGVGVDDLGALVDLHLAAFVSDRVDSRFTMLETVREFARELLEESGELERVERLHADYYVALAEAAEPALAGPDQSTWLERLELEHDELRAALSRLASWGDASRELRLAAALGRFRYVRGHLREGLATIESALARSESEPAQLRAKACRVASALGVLLGGYERALERAHEGLALYERSDDDLGVARSLSNVGAILVGLRRTDEAAMALDRAIELTRSLGDDRSLALALNNRADVWLTLGDWGSAISGFSESLELLRKVGDEVNIARSLFNLGVATFESGDVAAARRYLSESIDHCVSLDDKEDIAWCFVAFAAIHGHEGEVGRAAKLLGAADHLLAGMGASLKPYEERLERRARESSRVTLGEERFEALRAEGAGLPIADVVRLATAGAAADV